MGVKDYGDTADELEVGRYGLRTFKISGGHCRPVVVAAQHWKGGTCEAVCDKPTLIPTQTLKEQKHTAPHPTCTCGIYGSLTLNHLYKQYPQWAENIVCVIAAEGTTIIGSKGFRTQYARVVAWWAPSVYYQKIAAKDFPDAVHYQKLTEMLNTYGWDETVAENPMVAKLREQTRIVGLMWLPASVVLLALDLIDLHFQMSALVMTALQALTVVGFGWMWTRLRKKIRAFGEVA